MPIKKDLEDQLHEFRALKKREPSDYKGVDLNGLLTGHYYPDPIGTLGLAYVQGLCHPDDNLFVATPRALETMFDTPLRLAATITHELGHSFGLRHDTHFDLDCPCFTASNGHHCLMCKELMPPPYDWSDCTFNFLLEFSKKQKGCIKDVRDVNRESFDLWDLRCDAIIAGFALGVVLALTAIAVKRVSQ